MENYLKISDDNESFQTANVCLKACCNVLQSLNSLVKLFLNFNGPKPGENDLRMHFASSKFMHTNPGGFAVPKSFLNRKIKIDNVDLFTLLRILFAKTHSFLHNVQRKSGQYLNSGSIYYAYGVSRRCSSDETFVDDLTKFWDNFIKQKRGHNEYLGIGNSAQLTYSEITRSKAKSKKSQNRKTGTQ